MIVLAFLGGFLAGSAAMAILVMRRRAPRYFLPAPRLYPIKDETREAMKRMVQKGAAS